MGTKIKIGEDVIEIRYSVQGLTEENLKELWYSVGWVNGSASVPERLYIAMIKSSNVYTAWDNNKLIGLCSVLDDGLNAWISYMVVLKDYHNRGIGSLLIEEMLKNYADYRVFVQTNNASKFYEKHGFKEESHSMKLDRLKTGRT